MGNRCAPQLHEHITRKNIIKMHNVVLRRTTDFQHNLFHSVNFEKKNSKKLPGVTLMQMPTRQVSYISLHAAKAAVQPLGYKQ